MDDITKKKINECVKRALLYNSGKKLDHPLTGCFVNNSELENRCNGSYNPIRIPGEERIANDMGLDSNCFGCAFSKSAYYVSDALRYCKSMFALSAQNSDNFSVTKRYDFAGRANNIIIMILNIARKMCYLTFSDAMYNSATRYINGLDENDYYDIIVKIHDFCKENNIK